MKSRLSGFVGTQFLVPFEHYHVNSVCYERLYVDDDLKHPVMCHNYLFFLSHHFIASCWTTRYQYIKDLKAKKADAVAANKHKE